MSNIKLYEFFFKRHLKVKEKYERMISNDHPDSFLTKKTMELNERLMLLFKPTL